MLPSMPSTEEATATQQCQRLGESSFEPDLLSAAHSVPDFSQTKRSKDSILLNAEGLLPSAPTGTAPMTFETAGSSHRFTSERDFGTTLEKVNSGTVCGDPYCAPRSTAPELSHQHQKIPGTSPNVTTKPENPAGVVESSSSTTCLVKTETQTVDGSPVITSNYSATKETLFTTTRDVGNVFASQLYKRESMPSPPLHCGSPSVDSVGEKERNASDTDMTGECVPRGPPVPPPPPPPALATAPSSSPFSDNFRVSAAACRTSNLSLRRSSAAGPGEEKDVSCSTSQCQTEIHNHREDSIREEHEAAAPGPSRPASPSTYKVEHHPGGRGRKGEDALEVMTRMDTAVEALVAHAEDQGEQIRRLTLMVEDLSLKLDSLQEGLLSSQIGMQIVSPATTAETPAAATLTPGAPDMRQSRGRMVPPPLPRDKATDPAYGAAAQQGLPVFLRHGNNAAFERSSVSASYLASQREAENEILERRRAEEQREAQRREEERLRREEEERRRREEMMRRAAEEQRRREALDEKRKNIISSLISNKGGSTLFGDDGGAASHRNLFDD